MHPQKSKIISLSKGVDFVGFRNFYNFKLVRKRNIRNMQRKINNFHKGEINYNQLMESFQGWQAYAKWANTYKLRKSLVKEIYKIKKSKPITKDIERYLILI